MSIPYYNSFPGGEFVYPILQFFIRVTSISGFSQVTITGISELEINELRGRRENMLCVRTIIAALKGSA